MFNKLLMAGAAAGIIMLSACSSDVDVTPKRKFISLKLDSSVVLCEQSINAFYAPAVLDDAATDNDHSELLISGTTYQNDAIQIRLTSEGRNLVPGTYTNGNNGNKLLIERIDSPELLVADETVGDLTVKLHQISDSLAVGEFSGTLVSSLDGSLKVVKDGYFRMVYRNY